MASRARTLTSGAAAAKTLAGKSFTILGQWTGAEQQAFQAILTAFDKQTGANARYTPAAGGDVQTSQESGGLATAQSRSKKDCEKVDNLWGS